jgi:hypothetical protein
MQHPNGKVTYSPMTAVWRKIIPSGRILDLTGGNVCVWTPVTSPGIVATKLRWEQMGYAASQRQSHLQPNDGGLTKYKFHCNSNNKHCQRKLSYNLPNTIKKKIWRTFKPAKIRREGPSTQHLQVVWRVEFENRYPPQIQDIISHQFTWLPMDTPQSRTNIS